MRYKLKDIFDLQMGKTPSRNNSDYWNTEDYKWISIADLSKTGKYISDTKEYLSEVAVEESGIKVIPANTVVMSFKLGLFFHIWFLQSITILLVLHEQKI